MKSMITVLAGCLLTGGALASDETAAMEVARKHGCIACHHLDSRVVGPSWNEIKNKYAGQAEIVKTLAVRVNKGTKGTWGDLPMPPNTTIPDEELKLLLHFILVK